MFEMFVGGFISLVSRENELKQERVYAKNKQRKFQNLKWTKAILGCQFGQKKREKEVRILS